MGSKTRSIRKAMEERRRPPGIQTKEIKLTDWVAQDQEELAARRWQVVALLEWWEATRRRNVWWKRALRASLRHVLAVTRLWKLFPTSRIVSWAQRTTDPLEIFFALKYQRDMELAGVTRPEEDDG